MHTAIPHHWGGGKKLREVVEKKKDKLMSLLIEQYCTKLLEINHFLG